MKTTIPSGISDEVFQSLLKRNKEGRPEAAYPGEVLFLLFVTALTHHVVLPLVLQGVQDKDQLHCGLILREREREVSMSLTLVFSVVGISDRLTVFSWLGSTVITKWSLNLKHTISSKAGIFPAVRQTDRQTHTHTHSVTCRCAQNDKVNSITVRIV